MHCKTAPYGFTIFKKIVLWLSFFVVTQSSAQSLQNNSNTKGQRPFIDIDKVPASAFEQGMISIKFLPQFAGNPIVHQQGNIHFNIPVIDSLNKFFHVTSAKQVFASILNDEERIEQHNAWGFNLWYRLQFPSFINIKQIIKAYTATGLFEVVEPKYKASLFVKAAYTPNDPRFAEQWHFNNTGQNGGSAGKDISLAKAWDIETGKPDVIVSIHDQAIQLDHVDLAQNIAVGKSYNFIDNTPALTLSSSHGTHVAGTVAAVNNNAIGVSGIAGGNGSPSSGVRLMSCEVFGPANANNGFAESIVYAADNGACISTNSWGFSAPDVYEVSVLDAIDYFCEYGGGNVLQGGLVVCAGGNSGIIGKVFPGAYERVICVAATNYKDEKSQYSTYGDWFDIAAPGGDYSAGAVSAVLSTALNNEYIFSDGTSMSCPHVTGVAALVASVLRGKASANDVRNILLTTTDNISDINPNYKALLGSGRLNAYKALLKAKAFSEGQLTPPVKLFRATYGCTQFNLNWATNGSSNKVVVAVNNSSDFGNPTDGSSYTAGTILPGGGKIIYAGTATFFTLPVTDTNSTFVFKIWNADNNNNYSFGKTMELFVKPTVIASGANALVQNFNFPPLYPTKIWRSNNTNFLSSWIHTANDTAGMGAGDNYSMCRYNFNYDTQLGSNDTLSGPLLKVNGADSIILSFWRAYQFSNNGRTFSDTLEVVVSTDCGNTFSSVWKKGGAELATVTSNANIELRPFGIDKWKQETIDLSIYKNQGKILIGFRGYNGRGNNLFLDNINVAVRFKNDAGISAIAQPSGTTCNTQIAPQVKIKNQGNNTITSIKLSYVIDGGNTVSSTLNLALKKDADTLVTLALQNIAAGSHILKLYTSLPNNIADEFVLNDTLTTSFTISPSLSLPLAESFESADFPPANWEINQQPADNYTWQKTATAASKGNASAFMQNYLYRFNEARDDLITPSYQITQKTDSIFLLFDVAAATKESPFTTTKPLDTLFVAISKDCGNTWTDIYKKWGNTLQSINQTQAYTTQFVPTANQWRTDSLNISSLLQQGDVFKIRFSNIENYGNNIYLDNVRLYSKTLPAGLLEKGYSIYPNPFKQQLVVHHAAAPSTLKNIVLYNATGKRIAMYTYNGAAPQIATITTAHLIAGVYSVQLIYSGKTVTEKLIKLQ